jgi:small subunit ribosomal protein S6
MVRDYELMYIARPELDDDGLRTATESVEQIISAAGGSVVRTTSWGRRRLAYEVDHLRDGHYMLLHLRVDGRAIAAIERALSIHETVFRHLLVLHEGGAEAGTAEAGPGAVAAVAAEPAGGGAEPERQTAVAAVGEDADDDPTDEDDDAPASIPAGTEEEN